MRSELTTGPIVVNERCESIGPRAFSRAVTISPSLPLVGNWVLPVATAGEAEGEAPGDAEAPDAAGLGLADGLGLGLGLGLGEGVGAAEGLALAAADAA